MDSLYYLLLFGIAVLPVILLMIFIYRQDKYEKEPIKSLAKAFIGGILAIPLDIMIITPIELILGHSFEESIVLFNAFLGAGIPEELCKFIIFMIFIWRDKNFNEYFDGIVYATFIGLGFACVENIEYVFMFGFQTGVVRALISVPGHFLFGIIMGHFLSLAKFHPEKRIKYLLLGLLLPMLAHGLFDFLLMSSAYMDPIIGAIIYLIFIVGDIFLWKIGIRFIRRQQENSRRQAQEARVTDLEYQIRQARHGYDSEYKRIDWDAGDRQ